MAVQFATVIQQILIMFSMICIGYLCGKTQILNDEVTDGICRFVLQVVVPCTTVAAFQMEFSTKRAHEFGVALLAAAGIHGASFLVTLWLFRRYDRDTRSILCMSATLSNSGFIGYPMQAALIGPNGIFYGAPYTTIMSLFQWTIGAAMISGDKREVSVKSILHSPPMISVFLGLALFLGSIRLPDLVCTILDDIAAMNMPLPTVVIGYYLYRSKMDIRQVVRKSYFWSSAAVRLLFLPLLALGGMYLCGIRENVLLATSIAVSAPPASVVTMLASKYHKDTNLSSELVYAQTLLSILTMPCVVTLAGWLA